MLVNFVNESVPVCSQETQVVLFSCLARELACLDCFGAEGIGPDPPLCAAVQAAAAATALHLASSPFSNRAVNTSTFEAFTFGKNCLGVLGGVVRPGHHYLCIHLCSHWNNSRVPAAYFPPVWGQHQSRSAPPLLFLFNGMSR